MFFSSHVLSEVERVCDRVAIIREGGWWRSERASSCWPIAGATWSALRGTAPPRLEGVAGVTAIEVVTACSLDLEGDVGPFLAASPATTVRDLTIEPARLEEAFLEYYAPQAEGDR